MPFSQFLPPLVISILFCLSHVSILTRNHLRCLVPPYFIMYLTDVSVIKDPSLAQNHLRGDVKEKNDKLCSSQTLWRMCPERIGSFIYQSCHSAPLRQLPHALENPKAMLSTSEKRAIDLVWAKPFDGNSPLIRYILEVSENSKSCLTFICVFFILLRYHEGWDWLRVTSNIGTWYTENILIQCSKVKDVCTYHMKKMVSGQMYF